MSAEWGKAAGAEVWAHPFNRTVMQSGSKGAHYALATVVCSCKLFGLSVEDDEPASGQRGRLLIVYDIESNYHS